MTVPTEEDKRLTTYPELGDGAVHELTCWPYLLPIRVGGGVSPENPGKDAGPDKGKAEGKEGSE